MEFISIVEIIGTIAFAMSGALTAIEKDLDYYGIGIFAITTSVGGGIVRDLLIDRPLPASLENPVYALISLLSAGFVILFYTHINKLAKMLQFFDAIGLGAFTAIGAEVAVRTGLPAVVRCGDFGGPDRNRRRAYPGCVRPGDSLCIPQRSLRDGFHSGCHPVHYRVPLGRKPNGVVQLLFGNDFDQALLHGEGCASAESRKSHS